MGNIVYAKDMKCCVCGKQAVAFWPCCDPDIPSQPYCRECLDEVKLKFLIELSKIDNKRENKQIKQINEHKE